MKRIAFIVFVTVLLFSNHSVQATFLGNENPLITVEYPKDETTFYFHQNVSVGGYITADDGIIKLGYSLEWEHGFYQEINSINASIFYEFEFVVMIHNGWNNLTIHAITAEGHWGNVSLILFFQPNERILYVDDDGDADFTRIQDAVDYARDGDTVFVYNGSYDDYFPENLACTRIDKNIKLVGENKQNTILIGDGFQRVILINAANVSVSGFTIRHGKEKKGNDWILGIDIHYYRADHINIFDNIITNSSYGIRTHQSSANIYIHDNLIAGNYRGIECQFDKKPIHIYNNTIMNNEYGLFTYDSQIDLTSNMFTNNKIAISDVHSSSNYVIFQNMISENEIGIRLDTSITTVKHNNLVNNEKQVDVSMNFLLILFPSYLKYRQDWISNYWGEWQSDTPRPIRGKANIYILILRIHPKLTTEIKIGFLPYLEYDSQPAQEPYIIQ